MDKRQLVARVADGAGLTRTAAARAVESMMSAIVDAVASGDPVRLSGFGTFETQERAARVARNPGTGARVDVPAAVVPRFRASPQFRERVARGR